MPKLIWTAGLCLILSSFASSTMLVCYYNSLAANKPSYGQFTPSMIDPNLCTHMIYAFSGINQQSELVPTDPTTDPPAYQTFNDLKNSNSELKTLLAVGGPTFNTQSFSTMSASDESRSKFVTSAIALLRLYNFDGLNLDWRYPGGPGSQHHDKTRFTSLCKDLNTAFINEAKTSGDPRLILSASVSAQQTIIDSSYEVSKIAPYLDFINVLSFGFHDPTESVTKHHSPLFALSTETGTQASLNIDSAMKYWKSQGAPSAKLNMGIGAYGVAFTLSNPSNTGVGTPASGPAEVGCYSTNPGVWANYETCLYIKGGALSWIRAQKVPYAVTENQWVGYDNNTSLDAKAKYITTNNYGGACVWSLDLDDHTGEFCNNGSNPFIGHLKSVLPPGDICKGQPGVHPNPSDSSTYYNCDFGIATLQTCFPGLVFKVSCNCCDYPIVH